jgi:RNA polymerase sigma factor (TIGR02999 family)
MSDVTRILSAIEQGDPQASEKLLPLVYEELRKLAAQKMAQEAPAQTLQATALVHEAYLRLVGAEQSKHWDSRGHFFSAAAEAMRRILIDRARDRKRLKRGGDRRRIEALTAVLAATVLAVAPTILPLEATLPEPAVAQATAQAGAEQRITRIQEVLPLVVIKGERPQTVKLADRLQQLAVPGISIAVIRGGQVEWAQGFGVTQIGGAPVTADTLFQAASISKPLTALAVLRLVEAGTLDLDTDVNQYLKTWKVPDNEFTKIEKVTLRRLLTHSAGVNTPEIPGYAPNAPRLTVTETLESGAIRIELVPGRESRYANGGYLIVQQLLEDVTGEPFTKIMQELVLRPIGMSRSTYEYPRPTSAVAVPYRTLTQPVPGGARVYPAATGGLWTTPSDLARYALEVHRALRGESQLLSAAMARRMLTPGLSNRGLGLEVGGSKANPYFEHGGHTDGFQSTLVAYNHGDGVVIMTNGENGYQLLREVLTTIAHDYKWPDFQPVEHHLAKIDPRILDRYIGSYRIPSGRVAQITRDGDRLFAQFGADPKLEFFPESETIFFSKLADLPIRFQSIRAGRAYQLVVSNPTETANRMTEAEVEAVKTAQDQASRHFKEQTQDPRTEPAMRRLIGELWRGQPDYEQMTPEFADVTRLEFLPLLQPESKRLGALQSMSFAGVSPSGFDIYDVKFENGNARFSIMLTDKGKVAGAVFHRAGN